MSYTEFHKGKLRLLTRSTKETCDYIEQHNLEDVIKDTGWADEIEFDVVRGYEDKYIILHKDGIYYGDNMEQMLAEFIDYEHHEGGGDYYTDIKRTGLNDFEFTLIFYNGGTCEHEILSEEISKLLKEPWDKNKDTIEITSRESYMIMDVFQYVLNTMNLEKLDYLWCNYSQEEIAKLGQRFGDLNLKNGW